MSVFHSDVQWYKSYVTQEAANGVVTNGGVRPPGPNRPKWAQSVPNGPILNFPIFGPFSHKS